MSLKETRKDYKSQPDKYAKKPVEQAEEETNDFIEKVEEQTAKSWGDLMSHMIWIGGGAQVLMAQILLSDKLQYFSNYWIFKAAFFCLSTSLVISLLSFIANIIGGEFTLSANRASKQLMLETSHAKQQGSNEITDEMESSYGTFLDHAKIGGRATVLRNGILLISATLFFLGILAFVIFAGLNLDNLYNT